MAPLPTSDDAATAVPAGAHPGSGRAARVWRIARFVIGIALGLLAIYAIAGKSDELSGSTDSLEHLSWAWALAAAGAEAASYVAFALMQQRLLAAGKVRVGVRSMTAVALAGNVLQTSLPGGIVVSAAWSFRQFRRYGADDVLSGWVLVAMTAVSLGSLSLLAAVGLGMAASTGSALGLAGVIIGLVVIGGVVIFLWTRRMWLIGHATRLLYLSKRLVNRPRIDPHVAIQEALAKVAAISPSRYDWGVALGWAALNWLFDMGCLLLAFRAVGATVPWQGLLLAYAAAQLATNLPVTPGGLGVVEGSLTIALAYFGGAQPTIVAAVLLYRLLSFWAVLPVGGGTLGAMTWRHRRTGADPVVAPAALLPAEEAT